MEQMHGLAAVDYIYHNRDVVAKKLRENGKKIIGYLCNFAPPELMDAAGLIPYRIMGVVGENIVKSDKIIESYGCAYVRNCFEQDLLGRLDFLHGIVLPHSCDMMQRIYSIWMHQCKPAYAHLVNVPHNVTLSSKQFFMRELELFKESLEEFAEKKITQQDLTISFKTYNELRKLYKNLYELRREKPQILSGSEMTKISVVGMSIPPAEFVKILQEVTEDVTKRSYVMDSSPRLMLYGCVVDNTKLIELIEDSNAHLVVEDTCIGTRSYFGEIDTSKGVIEGLTKQYFEDFMCPRTQRGASLDRFKYILEMARSYQVKGIVAYLINYCDCHKLDYPDLRDYLKANGLAVLPIEDDYSLSNTEALRNRLEAFVEML